jgi:hypothetical protein
MISIIDHYAIFFFILLHYSILKITLKVKLKYFFEKTEEEEELVEPF